MTEMTDREREDAIFGLVKKKRALIEDGWMAVNQGGAAYAKDGKFLNSALEPVTVPKKEKPVKVEKQAEDDAA